jgi:orotate phosphoribosyltransferase
MDYEELLIEEIIKYRSSCVINDVHWNQAAAHFEGSFLWHGVPTSVEALRIFTKFVTSESDASKAVSVVIGISSSGIAWATAVALGMGLPLAVLRLSAHQYGPVNTDVRRHKGQRAYLIDNHFGSGETIIQAQKLLADYSIDVDRIFVVERRQCNASVEGLLSVDRKLRALLERGYFSGVEAEIAERYLEHKEEWLADQTWVRRVCDDLKRKDQCAAKE